MNLFVYSDRYAKEVVHDLKDNDYLVLQDTFSICTWKWLLKYKNINTKINIITIDELMKGELDNVKFDYIVGNPPYQTQIGKNGKTKIIWDTIILKCYSLLKYKGTMSMIHPGGWRFSNKSSNNNLFKIKEMYQNNKIIKMELHDLMDGLETFGAGTDYDIVILKKEETNGLVIVKTKTDGEVQINIKDYDKIPTDRFDLYNKYRAKRGEEKVQIIYDSNYHTSNGGDKCRTRRIKDRVFKYPVIDRMPLKEDTKFYYSNTNTKGHFGVPKLILGRAGYNSILDLAGKYGMTQFCAGIVDTPENLKKIQKVIESDEFKLLKKYFCGTTQNPSAIIDAPGTMFKFIKEFKKDFWKEFYTKEMEKELIEEGKLKN